MSTFNMQRIMFTILCILIIGPQCTQSDNFKEQRKLMVEEQVRLRGISDQNVIKAMLAVPREEFVLPEFRSKAYADFEVPVGEDQTLDRPYENALMLQSVKLAPSDKILEVGTGGGYLAALLSKMTASVYTIEIMPILAKAASERFKRLGLKNVEVKTGDGFLGWPEHVPFNAIILTCSPDEVPQPLVSQLAEGGRLLLPLSSGERIQEVLLYTKKDGKLEPPQHITSAIFVPMKGKILEK